MTQTSTTSCPGCGIALSADVIFCEHCFTLNPMVRDFLERNPKPHPKDYLTVDSSCPHCNKKTSSRHKSLKQHPLIHTPIRFCQKCGGYYLRHGALEWSVIPHSSKSQLHLLTTLFIKIELSIFHLLREVPLLCAIAVLSHLLLHLPIGYLYLHFTLPKAIHESNLRLERNPDYPQTLAKMGYAEDMQEKQSLREFLKEAFTFD